MDQTIEVIVGPDGEVTVEAHGYEGHDCLTATRAIEAALGQAAKRTMKPEARRTSATLRTRNGR